MTNLDVMTTVLSEVMGKSQEEVKDFLLIGVQESGSKLSDTKLMDELPDAEAQALLREFRANKSAILNWVVDGAKMALAQKEETSSRAHKGSHGAQCKQPASNSAIDFAIEMGINKRFHVEGRAGSLGGLDAGNRPGGRDKRF